MIHTPSFFFPSVAETLERAKRAARMGANLKARSRKIARAKRKKVRAHQRRNKR